MLTNVGDVIPPVVVLLSGGASSLWAAPVAGISLDEKTALNEQAARDYLDYVWTHYAEATQELERHIAEHGKTLLSIDATSGDTLLFALVTPDIAARWRDRTWSAGIGGGGPGSGRALEEGALGLEGTDRVGIGRHGRGLYQNVARQEASAQE